MSKPSILDQKIADVRGKRDACMLQVKMYDQVLELLESPVGDGAPKEPVQRSKRGGVQASVLVQLAGAPRSIAELETMTGGLPRSSIRKALIALGKDNKVIELADGKWTLKSVPALGLGVTSILPADHRGHPILSQNDDASVREE